MLRLATDRLILRELAESDAQRLYEIESAPGVGQYLTRYAQSLAEAEQYVASMIALTQLVPRKIYDFVITERGSDRMLGRSGFGRDDDEHRCAMLWYQLDPAVHGRGYATEAARAVLGFAFDELKLHRVWADADPRNPASIRVMERLGMRREGHFVENVNIRGEWCDSVIYAMLRREWVSR